MAWTVLLDTGRSEGDSLKSMFKIATPSSVVDTRFVIVSSPSLMRGLTCSCIKLKSSRECFWLVTALRNTSSLITMPEALSGQRKLKMLPDFLLRADLSKIS